MTETNNPRDLIKLLEDGCPDCNHKDYLMVERDNTREEYCTGCGSLIWEGDK